MNRRRSLSLSLAAIGFAAALGGDARAEAPALRLSLGAAYLHESWTPSGGSPGAVFSGAGTSLELSIGKRVRPRLVVGALWQLVAVSDPTESYLGTTYAASGTDRFLDAVAAFADFYPNPQRGLRVGGSAGVLAATNVDRECCVSTYWGGVVSVRVGWEVFVARRWSVGAVAQVEGYRYPHGADNPRSPSAAL